MGRKRSETLQQQSIIKINKVLRKQGENWKLFFSFAKIQLEKTWIENSKINLNLKQRMIQIL